MVEGLVQWIEARSANGRKDTPFNRYLGVHLPRRIDAISRRIRPILGARFRRCPSKVPCMTRPIPSGMGEVRRLIFELRGQRVILDRSLATLYGVSTARLNEAVKRNSARFPDDFAFRLSPEEHATLMSQIATSKIGRGGHRKPPWAFTEHGAIQAANVVNSGRAIEMGVHVVRAFVQLRELLATNENLARQLDALERKYQCHDKQIASMLATLRQLMNPSARERRGIGFTGDL